MPQKLRMMVGLMTVFLLYGGALTFYGAERNILAGVLFLLGSFRLWVWMKQRGSASAED